MHHLMDTNVQPPESGHRVGSTRRCSFPQRRGCEPCLALSRRESGLMMSGLIESSVWPMCDADWWLPMQIDDMMSEVAGGWLNHEIYIVYTGIRIAHMVTIGELRGLRESFFLTLVEVKTTTLLYYLLSSNTFALMSRVIFPFVGFETGFERIIEEYR